MCFDNYSFRTESADEEDEQDSWQRPKYSDETQELEQGTQCGQNWNF